MTEPKRASPWRGLAPFIVVALLTSFGEWPALVDEQRFDGFNVIVAPGHHFGSASARESLENAIKLGARAIAIVPFLWQSAPFDPEIVRGSDMTDAELRAAIGQAHALGLAAVVKPHVWVPRSWAGAIAMSSEPDWQDWFARYRHEFERIAGVANDEHAEALAIGTELDATLQRREWNLLIDKVREIYSGRLLYVAHDIEAAEMVPLWDRLDTIGVSLYPALGGDNDTAYRHQAMRAAADRLEALAARIGKPIVVGEVGVRSGKGAAERPWESVEERTSEADPRLQEAVLAEWLRVLERPAIRGVLVWRWFTDPDAGGMSDTDFTVQGKPAEHALMCAWRRECREGEDAGRDEWLGSERMPDAEH